MRWTALLLLLALVAVPVWAANSVTVSPSTVEPGGIITVTVDAEFSTEDYTVYAVAPDGAQYTVASGSGDNTYSWTVPATAMEGTWTLRVDSRYFTDVSTQFQVARPQGGGNGEAPAEVKEFFDRLLSLVMIIGWGLVGVAVVFAGILWLLGREAPAFLGRVFMAAFILAFGSTIIKWLVGG